VLQLPAEQQAQVFELSYDYIAYLRAARGDWPEAGKLSRELLVARSALNVPSVTPEVEVPLVRPDQGHKSLRVGLGGGNRDGVNYEELLIRPAYHDQIDPADGYIRGAQIQFFNLALRHYENGEATRVEKFVPVDIFSLSSRNDFFQSLSWKVNVGWARKRLPDGSEPLLSRINGGVGMAWDAPSLDHPVAQTYAFMDVTAEGASRYANGYALGMGPAAGVIADVNSNWRLNAYARVQRFGLGEQHTTADLILLQRYSIGQQTALRFEVARKMEFDMYWTDARLSLQQYF
jgi:hypothetical protein